VSSRTRSKASNPDQRFGVSTGSKFKSIYTLSAQSVLFPLHDVIPLNSHERPKNENLQLVVLECKIYHDALMNSKSRNDLDRLCNLLTLDMIEEDDDKSWQCSKMLEYNEERGASGEHQLNCLVEWKNINTTQS
jgi:hypothetical protein